MEHEIHNVIARYVDEAEIGIMDILAALEKVKLDAMHVHHKSYDDRKST